MSLKLAFDADNVAKLPVSDLGDIPAMLRGFGEKIVAGECGNVVSVISLAVTDDGMRIFVFGESATNYELMGLFEAAKLRVFADDVIADD